MLACIKSHQATFALFLFIIIMVNSLIFFTCKTQHTMTHTCRRASKIGFKDKIKRIEIKFPPSGKQRWSCACEQSVSEAGPQWVCAWSWETRISSLPTPRPRRVSQTLGRRRRDDVGDVRHGDQQTAAGFSGENQPLGWSEDSRQATRWDSPFKMFMFRLKCIIIVIFILFYSQLSMVIIKQTSVLHIAAISWHFLVLSFLIFAFQNTFIEQFSMFWSMQATTKSFCAGMHVRCSEMVAGCSF